MKQHDSHLSVGCVSSHQNTLTRSKLRAIEHVIAQSNTIETYSIYITFFQCVYVGMCFKWGSHKKYISYLRHVLFNNIHNENAKIAVHFCCFDAKMGNTSVRRRGGEFVVRRSSQHKMADCCRPEVAIYKRVSGWTSVPSLMSLGPVVLFVFARPSRAQWQYLSLKLCFAERPKRNDTS